MIFRRVTFAMEEREWIDSSDDLKLTIGLEMHVFVIFLALFCHHINSIMLRVMGSERVTMMNF